MLEHGGRLRRAAQHYGIPLADWLDLSTGINPQAYPVPTVPVDDWHRLPEDDDGLEAAAATYYGSAALLPVAGSQPAIQALPARCRQVMTLRKIYGLSHRDIAQQLGISEHTVNAQLAIGVLRLRTYLRAHGMTRTHD